MFISRNITTHLRDLLQYFPIVSLTGPRQAGKTTLLRFLLPEYEYVSLEDLNNREFAQKDPRGFLARYNTHTIFDEAQRVPELFSYLQTKVDLDGQKGQYILSGSQNFLLLQKITQSLAGRVGILRLMPLTYQELQAAHLAHQEWSTAAFQGSYPAIYKDDIPPEIFYANYLDTYIRRDVNEYINPKNIQQFERFLRLCAAFAGQLINYNSISNQLGISVATIKNWLSILESSYLVFQLSPYYRNFSKRIVKSSKLYFYDTGLVSYLLQIKSAQDLDNYYQKGALFENWVIAELYKQTWHNNKRPTFYFWQDSNKNEIDLLWESAQRLHLLEIKSSQTVLNRYFQNLSKMNALSPNEVEASYLVYAGTASDFEQQEVRVLNWQALDAIQLY